MSPILTQSVLKQQFTPVTWEITSLIFPNIWYLGNCITYWLLHRYQLKPSKLWIEILIFYLNGERQNFMGGFCSPHPGLEAWLILPFNWGKLVFIMPDIMQSHIISENTCTSGSNLPLENGLSYFSRTASERFNWSLTTWPSYEVPVLNLVKIALQFPILGLSDTAKRDEVSMTCSTLSRKFVNRTK